MTNSDIETNGGVYVIISTLPNFYLQFQQFIGRTGRIGNRGQYSIILFDKNKKNCDPEVYLTKKLLELQNNDVVNLSKIHYKNFNKYQYDQNQGIQQINSQENFLNDKPESQQSKPFLTNNSKNNSQDFLQKNFESIEKIFEYEEEKQLHEVKDIKVKNFSSSKEIGKKRIQKQIEKTNQRQSKRLQNKNSSQTVIDNGYFEGYSDPKIHDEMINDIVRMDTYEKAIQQTALNKIVIDVGAGTGILSMFAARAGATHTYAIEFSDISKVCHQAIKDNDFQSKVTVIQEKAEIAELPIKRADLIISEWMGYFLLNENMLSSVLHIRDKYLKEGGLIIPNNARIYLAAFQKENTLNGLNLQSIGKSQTKEARVEVIKSNSILTNSYMIFDFDLYQDSIQSNSFDIEYELAVERTGIVSGFVGWFVVNMLDQLELSTSPYEQPTHWKQTIFMLEKDINVDINDKIYGTFKVEPFKENYRALQFQITYQTTKDMRKKVQKFVLQ